MTHESPPPSLPPSNRVLLFVELKRRTSRPVGQIVFLVYFAAGILILGGSGVLLEFLRLCLTAGERDWASLYTALLTYSPAIAGPALLQIMFETQTNRRMMAFVVLSGFWTAALIIGLFLFAEPWGTLAWILAALACLGSAWLWWIANADNATLHDDPDAPLGGSATAPLTGGYGNFKV